MPKIEVPDWTEEPALRHPALDVVYDAYAHKALGDAAGLTQFGAHLERLPPGARSSLRHWHEAEDELVYVVAGEVVLIEEAETVLRPGVQRRGRRAARSAIAWRTGGQRTPSFSLWAPALRRMWCIIPTMTSC